MMVKLSLVISLIIFAFIINILIKKEDIINRRFNKIITKNNDIMIYYDKNDINIENFLLESSLYGEKILFDYKSFINISHNETCLVFSVILPSKDIFDCKIIYYKSRIKIDPIKNKVLNTDIISTNCLKLQLRDDFEYQNYSLVKCFGDNYVKRICSFNNLVLHKKLLLFITPAYYKFPSPLLLPGSRGPPYDRREDRLYDEPLIYNGEIDQLGDYIVEDNVTYIMGRFFNSIMLWHTIYDFLLPAWETIKFIEGDKIFDNKRKVYVKDNEYFTFSELTSIFSSTPIKNINDINETIVFRKAHVGLLNFEVSYHKKDLLNIQMNNYKYNFNKTHGNGIREYAIKKLNITLDNKPRQPIIIIIKRGTERDITNIHEIQRLIQESCSFCNVSVLDFSLISVRDQIKVSAESSAIIGIHGSGLSNVIWMSDKGSRPTSLIEVFPYNYWCRDWYHMAANVAGVEYYSYIGHEIPKLISKYDKNKYKYCYSSSKTCTYGFCHDFLRDKPVTIAVDDFMLIWKQFQKKLQDFRSYNSVSKASYKH